MKSFTKYIVGACLLSASVWAAPADGWNDGTLEQVITYKTGQTGLIINIGGTSENYKIDTGVPHAKEMLAIALTAKASTQPIAVFFDDSTNTWKGIIIK